MVNWEKIDYKIFENIAYDYMSNNYPELRWERTKLTNDGNKDGESVLSSLPLNVTVKYWYEAKFSVHTKTSINKGHLDSTLVSSILDGHVVVIAFITNAYISDDYKRRADIFAKQRDNMKILYINGEDIEYWLTKNPEIELKYFATNSASLQIIEDKIEGVDFLDKYNTGSNQYLKLTTLELNKEYYLYVRLHSSKKQTIKILAEKGVCFIEEYSNTPSIPTDLEVEQGYNTFLISVKLTSKEVKYTFLFCYLEKTLSYIISNLKIIDLYKPQLIIKSQIEIQNDINMFIKSNDKQNQLFLITGESGTGKSYTLNCIRDNIRNSFSNITFNFSGKTEHDLIICYKIFIYCQYGDLWNLDIKDFSQFKLENLTIEILKEINNGISTEHTIANLRKYCVQEISDNVEQNLLQQHIYLDDIHKLSKNSGELLKNILEWCICHKLNKKIFVFSRIIISNSKNLNDFLLTNSYYYKELKPPCLTDIKCSIENNLNISSEISNMIINNITMYNALYLYDFICALKEKTNLLKSNDLVDISIIVSDILNGLNFVDKNKMGNQLLKEYGNSKIFYFVYKIGTGISLNAFLEFYDDYIYKDISYLCKKRIIKEVSGKLYPFHDILLESFNTYEKNFYLDELGAFILQGIEKKFFSQSEGYYCLISLGSEFFWKYRSIAKKYRDQLYLSTNYHGAGKIAQKIYEENQKEYRDYDYEDVKNLFILGNCYKYTTSYEASTNEFRKIIEIYKNNSVQFSNDILLETYSEIVNNNLWMLNIQQADIDLKKLAIVCMNDEDILNKSKTHKYGYLNYYNRRMFCNFMLDKGSEEDYLLALGEAKRLGLAEYEGFAYMDYAKSIYNRNISLAEDLLKKSIRIFEEKGEYRRLLDAWAEQIFIGLLQKKMYIESDLQLIYNHMLEKNYIQSSTKTHLKILVIMLLSNKYSEKELLENTSKILTNNTTIASGRRHQAFVYHILAAIHYKAGNIKQSKIFTQKCLKMFSELGESYKKIQKNNLYIQKTSEIVLSIEENQKYFKGNFILDVRIW